MAWFIEWWWVMFLLAAAGICSAIDSAASKVCRSLDELKYAIKESRYK